MAKNDSRITVLLKRKKEMTMSLIIGRDGLNIPLPNEKYSIFITRKIITITIIVSVPIFLESV